MQLTPIKESQSTLCMGFLRKIIPRQRPSTSHPYSDPYSAGTKRYAGFSPTQAVCRKGDIIPAATAVIIHGVGGTGGQSSSSTPREYCTGVVLFGRFADYNTSPVTETLSRARLKTLFWREPRAVFVGSPLVIGWLLVGSVEKSTFFFLQRLPPPLSMQKANVTARSQISNPHTQSLVGFPLELGTSQKKKGFPGGLANRFFGLSGYRFER